MIEPGPKDESELHRVPGFPGYVVCWCKDGKHSDLMMQKKLAEKGLMPRGWKEALSL